MEFLSTYGFSILVLLVIIGVVFSIQTFKPRKLLPERCSLGTALFCRDQIVNNTHMRLSVNNALAEPIELRWMHINESGSAPRLSCIFGGDNLTEFTRLLYNSSSCTGVGVDSDDLVSFDTTMVYVERGSDLEHTQRGILQVKVHS